MMQERNNQSYSTNDHALLDNNRKSERDCTNPSTARTTGGTMNAPHRRQDHHHHRRRQSHQHRHQHQHQHHHNGSDNGDRLGLDRFGIVGGRFGGTGTACSSSLNSASQHSAETPVFTEFTWMSLLGLLKPQEFVVPMDQTSLWRSHVAWAKPAGGDIRDYTTQRFSSNMVFLSLLLGAELGVFFNSATFTESVLKAMATESYGDLKFYIGATLSVAVACTVIGLVATFSAWGMISAVSDSNAHTMLRSSMGQYVCHLPARFVVAALYLFLLSLVMCFVSLMRGPFVWFLLCLVVNLFFHVVVALSAFGRLIVHTGAMGHRRVLDPEFEKCLLPSGLHASLLIKATERKRRRTSAISQYQVVYGHNLEKKKTNAKHNNNREKDKTSKHRSGGGRKSSKLRRHTKSSSRRRKTTITTTTNNAAARNATDQSSVSQLLYHQSTGAIGTGRSPVATTTTNTTAAADGGGGGTSSSIAAVPMTAAAMTNNNNSSRRLSSEEEEAIRAATLAFGCGGGAQQQQQQQLRQGERGHYDNDNNSSTLLGAAESESSAMTALGHHHHHTQHDNSDNDNRTDDDNDLDGSSSGNALVNEEQRQQRHQQPQRADSDNDDDSLLFAPTKKNKNNKNYYHMESVDSLDQLVNEIMPQPFVLNNAASGRSISRVLGMALDKADQVKEELATTTTTKPTHDQYHQQRQQQQHPCGNNGNNIRQQQRREVQEETQQEQQQPQRYHDRDLSDSSLSLGQLPVPLATRTATAAAAAGKSHSNTSYYYGSSNRGDQNLSNNTGLVGTTTTTPASPANRMRARVSRRLSAVVGQVSRRSSLHLIQEWKQEEAVRGTYGVDPPAELQFSTSSSCNYDDGDDGGDDNSDESNESDEEVEADDNDNDEGDGDDNHDEHHIRMPSVSVLNRTERFGSLMRLISTKDLWSEHGSQNSFSSNHQLELEQEGNPRDPRSGQRDEENPPPAAADTRNQTQTVHQQYGAAALKQHLRHNNNNNIEPPPPPQQAAGEQRPLLGNTANKAM